MKKIISILLILSFTLTGYTQGIRISDMPTFAGNPGGGFVPVVIAGTNRKVDASYFGYGKVDSLSVSSSSTKDTLWLWKNHTKNSYLTIAKSVGGGPIDTTRDGTTATLTQGVYSAVLKSANEIQAGLLSAADKVKLNKFDVFQSPAQLRSLTSADVTILYNFVEYKIPGEFYYDPFDVTTPDDTVMTIVTTGGQRMKRYVKDVVNVKWFGATGDGSTNDYTTVQKAIDYCVYHNYNVLYFPAGNYKNNTKGWLVWKDVNVDGNPEIASIEIRGQGTAYGVNTVNETTLSTGLLNTFLFGFERVKGLQMSNINLLGPNQLNYSFATAVNPATTYAVASLRITNSSPSTGLIIDPFDGAIAGANQYPGFSDKYGVIGNGGSTDCHFSNVRIDGFYVNITLTAPSSTLQNDENISFDHTWLTNAYIGALISQGQSRNVTFTDTKVWNSVHTVFSTSKLGANGEAPIIDNLNVAGNIYELFDLAGDNIKIKNVHAESFYRIGKLAGITAEVSGSLFDPADMASFSLRYPDYILEILNSQVKFTNSRIVYYVATGNKTPLNVYLHGGNSSLSFDNAYLSNELGQSSGNGYTQPKILYNITQQYNSPGQIVSSGREYSDQNFVNDDGNAQVQILNLGTDWTTYNPAPGGNLYQTRTSKSAAIQWVDIGYRDVTVSGNTASLPSPFTGGYHGYLVGEVLKAYLADDSLTYAQIGKIASIDNDGTIHLTRLINRLTTGNYLVFYPVFNTMPVLCIGSIAAGTAITNVVKEVTGTAFTWPVNTAIYINGIKRTVTASSSGSATIDAAVTETDTKAVLSASPIQFSENGKARTSPETAAGSNKVLFTKGSFYANIGPDTIAGWQCIETGISNTAYLPRFIIPGGGSSGGSGSDAAFYPQTYGAVTNNSAIDNSTPVNTAIVAAHNAFLTTGVKQRVPLSAGTWWVRNSYRDTATVNKPSGIILLPGVILQGAGIGATKIKASPPPAGATFNSTSFATNTKFRNVLSADYADYAEVRDLTIDGNIGNQINYNINPYSTPQDGLAYDSCSDGARFTRCRNLTIENVKIDSTTGYALSILSCPNSYINHIQTGWNINGGVYFSGYSKGGKLSNSQILNSSCDNIRLRAGDITIDNCEIAWSKANPNIAQANFAGIYIENDYTGAASINGIKINNCRIHDNSSFAIDMFNAGDTNYYTYPGTSVMVSDVFAYRNANMALQISMPNIVIDGCHLQKNGADSLGWSDPVGSSYMAVATHGYASNNLIVRNCDFLNNVNQRFAYGSGSVGPVPILTFSNNTVKNGAAIINTASYDLSNSTVIHNNSFTDSVGHITSTDVTLDSLGSIIISPSKQELSDVVTGQLYLKSDHDANIWLTHEDADTRGGYIGNYVKGVGRLMGFRFGTREAYADQDVYHSGTVLSRAGMFWNFQTGAPAGAFNATDDFIWGPDWNNASVRIRPNAAGPDILTINGNNASRSSLILNQLNSAGYGTMYLRNNRQSFSAQYGGMANGGSTTTGSLLGVTAADRFYLFANGTNSTGLAIGTLNNAPFTIGTNDVNRLTISSAGVYTFHALASVNQTIDTTNYKPLVLDASGNGKKMNWPVFTGGSGYSAAQIDSLNNIKDFLSVKTITTTNATPVNPDTVFINAGNYESIAVEVEVISTKTTSTGGGYHAVKRKTCYNNTSVLSEFSAGVFDVVADEYKTGLGLSTASITIIISGSYILIQFTGEASTNIQTTTFTHVKRTKYAP